MDFYFKFNEYFNKKIVFDSPSSYTVLLFAVCDVTAQDTLKKIIVHFLR